MAAYGVDADFWAGRRVFVTGHTGFKGAWLTFRLLGLGAKVTGFALPPATEPNLFESLGLADGMQHVPGDIRDAESLSTAVAAAQPEVVLHLAAQALVRPSFDDPVGTFATNVMGTVNLLQALRDVSTLKAIVAITSDKVYDNREWPWGYRESDALGGREPYGGSKACCEHVVEAFARSYFRPAEGGPGIASLRAGNVIGGGDWASDRLIPDAVRAFTKGNPLRLRNPAAVRPWQHVLEPLEAYLDMAQRLAATPADWSGAWNVGPAAENARPVSWIAEQLCQLWGDGARWEVANGNQPYEARLLHVDSGKLSAAAGYRPTWPIETALANTVTWYRVARERGDLRTLSQHQVEQFLEERAA